MSLDADAPNAWMELNSPLRVTSAAKSINTKVMQASMGAPSLKLFGFFLCCANACMNAVSMSHGTRDDVSTGSQLQKPPQPSIRYAHIPPTAMPRVKKSHVNLLVGNASFTHPLSPVRRNTTAAAKGTTAAPYGMNMSMGCDIIQGLMSNAFNPLPSGGMKSFAMSGYS